MSFMLVAHPYSCWPNQRCSCWLVPTSGVQLNVVHKCWPAQRWCPCWPAQPCSSMLTGCNHRCCVFLYVCNSRYTCIYIRYTAIYRCMECPVSYFLFEWKKFLTEFTKPLVLLEIILCRSSLTRWICRNMFAKIFFTFLSQAADDSTNKHPYSWAIVLASSRLTSRPLRSSRLFPTRIVGRS